MAGLALDPEGRPVWPDVATPPGEHIVEILEAKRWTQKDLARRMRRPLQAVNEICRGAKAITVETAMQLEAALKVSAKTWLSLEAVYRANRARLDSLARLKELRRRQRGRHQHP